MSRLSGGTLSSKLRVRSWVVLLCLLAVLSALLLELVLFRKPWVEEEVLSEERKLRKAYETFELIQNSGPYELRRVYKHLRFRRPLGMARSEDGRWFVAEREGRLLMFEDDPETRTSELLLDLGDRLDHEFAEEGLLNVALHPQFVDNGRLFIFYSATGVRRNVLVEYRMDPEAPNRLDLASERLLLTISKRFTHHNGGGMLFGPNDGMLYLAVGDGGGWGDPLRHGQNLATLFAKMLRIDVDRKEQNRAYGIPTDNPFVKLPGARPEIWAHGLRNAWRFSFDRETGEMWAGDVGQDNWEEVNIIRRGGNYGWNFFEGSRPFLKAPDRVLSALDISPPIWEYDHYQGAAIVGGYVYRGDRLPVLQGAYIYADYAFGMVMMLRYEEGEVVDQRTLVRQPKNITSFAEGPDGEIYLLAGSGEIFVLEPRSRIADSEPEN